MFREFARGTLFYGISHFLSSLAAFILLPIVSRFLTPEDYGRIETVKVLGILVQLVFAVEISQAFALCFGRARTDEDRVAYSSTYFVFTVLLYLSVGTVLAGFAGPIGTWVLEGAGRTRLFVLAIVCIATAGVYGMALDQLRWQLKPGRFAACEVACTLVTAAVTALLLVVPRLGIASVFWGQLAGQAVGTALALGFGRTYLRLRFDVPRFREMVGLSLPLVPASIAAFALQYADRLTLKETRTMEDVGLYAAACKIGAIAGIGVAIVQRSLTPLIVSRADAPETPRQLADLFRVFLLMGLSLFVGLSVFSREVALLMIGPQFRSVGSLAPLTVGSVILSGMVAFAPGWWVARKTGAYAMLTIALGAAQSALLFVLVPRLGIVGAAASSLAGGAVLFISLMILSQRLYPIPYDWSRICPACGFAILIAVLHVALDQGRLGPWPGPPLAWKALLLLAGVAVPALILVRRGECAAAIRRLRDFRKMPTREGASQPELH